jgi:sugar phosphate isomerase/epimerase
MQYSICSYSQHRIFAAGKMDIFGWIEWNRASGFTQLDPWMKHIEAGFSDDGYLAQVKAAAAHAGLPLGCIAVDGAHIYESSAEARAANRQKAYRWIDVAQILGANQVRIDCGGPEEMPADVFAIIVEGYHDILAYARPKGVEIIMENHCGPSKHPENVVKIMEANPSLGLLFDSYNWAPDKQQLGWELCAKYARCTHFKTFAFNERGEDVNEDIPKVIGMLQATGYQGVWGIESTPDDGDELGAGVKTLAWLKRILEAK